MNKKVKWGLIAFIACGLVVWGVYSQLPKLNSELAQADKVESGDKAKKNILNILSTSSASKNFTHATKKTKPLNRFLAPQIINIGDTKFKIHPITKLPRNNPILIFIYFPPTQLRLILFILNIQNKRIIFTTSVT